MRPRTHQTERNAPRGDGKGRLGPPRFGFGLTTCRRVETSSPAAKTVIKRAVKQGMPMNKRLLIFTILSGAAGAAQADVAVNTTTTGKASIMNVTGNGVTRIKGKRQRIDQTVGGKPQSLILDIDNRRFV